MANLWDANTPAKFWQCQPNPDDALWYAAIESALPLLGLPVKPKSPEDLAEMILGEQQFGADRWHLSRTARLYYELKPLIPRWIIQQLRRVYNITAQTRLAWPIEDRYVAFLWEVARQLLILSEQRALPFKALWPDGKQFAFVLRHDIETEAGQAYVRQIADLDEQFGFHSIFNFVAERYPLDFKLIEDLKARGFEIGVHGLHHDGKDFYSEAVFMERAQRVNQYISRLGSVTFAAPLTHRQAEWMQVLDVEYDQSFFDTDPFEPMPGGVMTIYPYFVGRFVEIPYTLPQDNTLIRLLGETTPRIWLEKVAFIEQYHGMALLNSHPDYLQEKRVRDVYVEFLKVMQAKTNYWHALPRDVARWWRNRSEAVKQPHGASSATGAICLTAAGIELVDDAAPFLAERYLEPLPLEEPFPIAASSTVVLRK